MIKTPDILPNNLRIIREMKDKTTDETSQALGLNRSYISVLENNKANMSGKIAIAIMQYFDVNFYQLFDMEDDIELDHTIKNLTDHRISIKIPKEKLAVLSTKDFNLIEAVDLIKDELAAKGIQADEVHEFEFVEKADSDIEGIVDVLLAVTTATNDVVKETFNINFANEIDSKLFEALIKKGFTETKKVHLKKNEFTIEGDIYILNKDYNIIKNNLIENTNKIHAGSEFCKFGTDKDGEVISLTFNTQIENLYNIKFIENYLEIDNKTTEKELGISNNGYINIVNGNQKISTKIMWKLVKLFKVPLEYIVNIRLYSERFL